MESDNQDKTIRQTDFQLPFHSCQYTYTADSYYVLIIYG